MGENIFKPNTQQAMNIQNVQRTQQLKRKEISNLVKNWKRG
jgi:hypothetical protein